MDDTTEISGECSVANNILEEDWLMPAEAIEQNIPLKANTFMASKSRLDDKPRMLKVKKENGQFIESTFSVYEREIMLGLPKRYVEDAGTNTSVFSQKVCVCVCVCVCMCVYFKIGYIRICVYLFDTKES